MESSSSLLLSLFLLVIVPFSLAEERNNGTFLWKPLLEIPVESLDRVFIPNYLNINILENGQINQQCRKDFRNILDAMHQRKSWAFEFFNSWARFPASGLFRGTFTDYGDYDQCMNIDLERLIPQYCLLDLALPMPPIPKHQNYFHKNPVLPELPEEIEKYLGNENDTIFHKMADQSSVFFYAFLRFGICLPIDCSGSDIRMVVDKELNGTGLELRNIICTEKNLEPWKPNPVQIFAIITGIIVLLITLTAALYDRFVPKKSGKIFETMLLWFSPIKNAKKLLSTEAHGELACIHGIRFLTITWIVIGHTLEWNNLNSFRDVFTLKSQLSALRNQPLFKCHYSVDTFFYISGLLSSYVTIKFTMGDIRKFHTIPYVVIRYLRLTPQLVIFLLAFTLLPPMFDGPLWNDYMSKVTSKCSKTWWHNLIYLQNFIDIENICAIHTWYLAADMQLHWMSILPVVLILRNRNQGRMFTKFLILVCICISSVTIALKNLPPGTVITSKNDFLDLEGRPSEFISFFYKPWNHATVFFIGFILGSYLNDLNPEHYVLRKSTRYLYWIVAFCAYLFCMFSTSPWLYGRPYDPFWSAILFPLNRTIWALLLTLVIWLCLTNNGSVVGRILSWPVFKPLSRMTYAVYLTHAWVLYVALGSRRNLIDTRVTSIVILCASIILLSYMVAFVFTLLFESPLILCLEWIRKNLLAGHQNGGRKNIIDQNANNSQKIQSPSSSVKDKEKELFNVVQTSNV